MDIIIPPYSPNFDRLRKRLVEKQNEQDNSTDWYPTRLQDFRDYMFFRVDVEQELYVNAYNCIIDVKLEKQAQTKGRMITTRNGQQRKSPCFSRTRVTDRVSDYGDLQIKYKPSSLRSMELKLRKLILFALVGDPYSAENWVSLLTGVNCADEITETGKYPELIEGLREALNLGYLYRLPSSKTKRRKATQTLEKFLG